MNWWIAIGTVCAFVGAFILVSIHALLRLGNGADDAESAKMFFWLLAIMAGVAAACFGLA